MSKRLLALITAVAASAVALHQSARAAEHNIVISGVTKDCAPGETFHVSGVAVAAFDPEANPQMVYELRVMDTVDFDADLADAVDRFNAGYWRLDSLLTTSAPLALDSTNSGGFFSLNLPATDSVLVVAHAIVEDEPYYYSYKMVPAQNDTALVLDMRRGQCAF